MGPVASRTCNPASATSEASRMGGSYDGIRNGSNVVLQLAAPHLLSWVTLSESDLESCASVEMP